MLFRKPSYTRRTSPKILEERLLVPSSQSYGDSSKSSRPAMPDTSRNSSVTLCHEQMLSAVAMDLSNEPPDQVIFVRFITQNLAYFEYGRSDELFHTILQLENLVGKTGADLAQAIDALIGFTMHNTPAGVEAGVGVDSSTALVNNVGHGPAMVDPATLKPLVAAAMVLSMLWETRTHLKRQFGITQDVRQLIGKGTDPKELAKAPAKVHGVSGERFWDNIAYIMASLDSYDAMLTRCHEFTNLMNVDDDVKVAAEDDDTREAFSASVGPDGEISTSTIVGKESRPGTKRRARRLWGARQKRNEAGRA